MSKTIEVDPVNLKRTLIGVFGIPWVIIGVLSQLPFHQAVESVSNDEFQTYFKMGWIRRDVKTYSKRDIKQIVLEQDESRFYCLTIKFSNAPDWIIEKHATLDAAEQRLAELRTTIQ